MTTLQQQRQAIAAGMAASRAPTGQSQRQAGGQAMVERRTGTTVADDINRLTEPRPPRRTLPSIEPVGALPPSRGRGVYKEPSTGAGTGLLSPIEEVSRTRHPLRIVESSDGLVAFTLRCTNELIMRDANGVEEVRRFADAE